MEDATNDEAFLLVTFSTPTNYPSGQQMINLKLSMQQVTETRDNSILGFRVRNGKR